jgi:hypothetical protein
MPCEFLTEYVLDVDKRARAAILEHTSSRKSARERIRFIRMRASFDRRLPLTGGIHLERLNGCGGRI